MNSKFLPATTLALFLACALNAQPIEPPAEGKIGLSLSTAATASGKGDLKANGTTYQDISVRNASCTLNQHLALGQRRRLSLVLDYERNEINVPTSTPVPLPERLQSLGASLRYFQSINPQWMLSASVGAASSVTENGLLSEGWGVRASSTGIYNRSRQLTFVFGLAFNSTAEDLRIMPIVGCDWRPTDKWSIAIGFPRTGVTYKLNKQVSLNLAVSGAGGAYYVKDDPRPGIAPRSLADSRLQYLDLRLGLGCNWKINDTFRISGTVGQVLLRQIKYIDRDYKLRSEGTTPFLSLSGTLSL